MANRQIARLHSVDSDVFKTDEHSEDESRFSASTHSTLSGRKTPKSCTICGSGFRIGKKRYECRRCQSSVCRTHSRRHPAGDRTCDHCIRKPLEQQVLQAFGDPLHIKKSQLQQLQAQRVAIDDSIRSKSDEIERLQALAKRANEESEQRLSELFAKVEEENRLLLNKKAVIRNLKTSAAATQSAETTQNDRLQTARKQLEEVKDYIANLSGQERRCQELIEHFAAQAANRLHVTQVKKIMCADCLRTLAGAGFQHTQTASLETSANQRTRPHSACPEGCFLF